MWARAVPVATSNFKSSHQEANQETMIVTVDAAAVTIKSINAKNDDNKVPVMEQGHKKPNAASSPEPAKKGRQIEKDCL
jgi:hypothetical protein